MESIALIVEYNPLHNGHQYQIDEARRLFPTATLIAILNGDFLQRGEPAFVSKRWRAKWAILAGCDLVFELPFAAGTQRADIFATAAVDIAVAVGATILMYGIEHSLPPTPALDELHPNQKLGYFYEQAIHTHASAIRGLPIKRVHSNYHETAPQHDTITSATAIRTLFRAGEPNISQYLPDFVSNDLKQLDQVPGQIENYFPALKYSLMTQTLLPPMALQQHGASANVRKNLLEHDEFSPFFAAIHQKHMSKTHTQRLLTYQYCQIQQVELDLAQQQRWTRVLALSAKGQAYLRQKKTGISTNIKLIHSIKQLPEVDYMVQYKSTVAYALLTQQNIRACLTRENSPAIFIPHEEFI